MDCRQAAAVAERSFADTCHTLRNRHTRQTAAAVERTHVDARHTVRNRHAR